MTTFDVVCTTIGNGAFIRHYANLIHEAELEENVRLVVIPDLTTASEIYGVASYYQAEGIRIACLDPEDQETFLKSLGDKGLFPWRSDNRRNIGYLLAWRDQPDVIISVDDDNLPGLDFFAEHAVVARPHAPQMMMHSSSHWFNPCELLKFDGGAAVWPRGYPYNHREPCSTRMTRQIARVGVNAGLWLGEPDVDAITRLGAHPFAMTMSGESAVLGTRTWMPINSQNTALRHDLLPAYYFVRMGHATAGRAGDRYGDIYSGYMVEACAKALGDHVRVGLPLTRHERNTHDLLRDLRLEHPHIEVMDEFADWLTSVRLTGNTYRETYLCLAEELADKAEHGSWNDEVRGMFHRMTYHMRCWIRLCDQIGTL